MMGLMLRAWKGGDSCEIIMGWLVIESVMLKVIYRLLFNLFLLRIIILLLSREEQNVKRLWVVHYNRPILELPGVGVSAIVT